MTDNILDIFIRSELKAALLTIKNPYIRSRIIESLINPIQKILIKNNHIVLSKLKVLKKPGFNEKSIGFNECIKKAEEILE